MVTGLGQLLRQIRKARGLTLEQAAQSAGLSRSAVNRWETGVNQPRLTELNSLLTALGASPQQKRACLAQMDAVQTRTWMRETAAEIAVKTGLESQPHSGDLLQALRLRRGLSLENAAEQIGVTVRTLRRWEKGEVCPSIEHLHCLCYVVGAREEEVVALTTASLASPLSSYLTPRTFDELEHQYLLLSQQVFAGDRLPLELLLFTLESQIWGLAARTDKGKTLLARAYVLHCRYLDGRGRYGEAGKYGEQALALLSHASHSESMFLDAMLFTAQGIARSGTRHAARNALTQIRPLLTMTFREDRQAWLFSNAAAYLIEMGAIEEGLALSKRACRLVEQCHFPGERDRRLFDHCELLIQTKQSVEELTRMSELTPDTPYFDAHLTLAQVEGYLAIGEKSAAQERLAHFDELQQSYSLEALRPRAEEFALRI